MPSPFSLVLLYKIKASKEQRNTRYIVKIVSSGTINRSFRQELSRKELRLQDQQTEEDIIEVFFTTSLSLFTMVFL